MLRHLYIKLCCALGVNRADIAELQFLTPRVRQPCRNVLMASICLKGMVLALGFFTVLALMPLRVAHSTVPSCRKTGRRQGLVCTVVAGNVAP